MNTFVKIGLYTLALLFTASLYKDLTVGTPIHSDTLKQAEVVSDDVINSMAAHVRVMKGETVLSIVEDLNEESIQEININQILNDFKKLNPETKPLEIKAGSYYYFPLYNRKEADL
ncbi:hypothetical protein [Virgibacillus siamensis]|uniref:hypothetical protein n=1 Tax=Virgibacillus siamensis TaxID=480071 RepID=UPI000984F1FC|nr:hypothetical protein [Virgibacillus siamensis]